MHSSPTQNAQRGILIILAVALLLGLASLPAQQPKSPSAKSASTSPPNELVTRLAAAAQARTAAESGTGSPDTVHAANQLVAASALRELGDLKMVESAFPAAIEAYSASLALEDSAPTRVNLAIANVQAGKYDEAIRLATEVHNADPANLRADRALASALIQSGKPVEAVAPFTRIATAEPEVDNLYPLAVCLLQTKKPEDIARAQAAFDKMRSIAGDSGSLHVLIGRAYRDADDMPSAIREFQRAIAIDPHTPHAHYFLGLARLYSNDWKPSPEAEAELRQEAQNFPHDYLANYMLGFLLSGERQYPESNKYLTAASKIDPTAPEPFLYLGLNAYSAEDAKQAEINLRKAVDLTGNDEARSNYQIRRAYVDLGRILAAQNRTEESDKFVAKARELQNKTMVETQQNVASMAAADGKSNSAAVMPLSAQKTVDTAALPNTSNLTLAQRTDIQSREKELASVLALAYNDIATSLAIQHNFDQALASYHQAEHYDPTLPGLAKNIGQCAFRVKNYPEAARALSIAVQAQPDSLPLHGMLGIAEFSTDQYKEAAQAFAPLGDRGMHDSETGYAWAASLTHLGDMKQATTVLTAYESEPRSPDTQLLIGQLWTEIGDYPRASATLNRALAANPSLPKAHLYLGLVDIHSQKWSEAATEFQSELALSPSDPSARYHLGYVYLQQAKTAEAAAQFTEVIAAHPDYANAQYELGKILLDQGQLPDAVKHLEAAATLSPQVDYIHYQLQAAYRKANRPADADRELETYKHLKASSRERAADSMRDQGSATSTPPPGGHSELNP